MSEGPGLQAMTAISLSSTINIATAALAHILRQNPDPEWRERVRLALEMRAKQTVIEGVGIEHDAVLMEAGLTMCVFIWECAVQDAAGPERDNPFV